MTASPSPALSLREQGNALFKQGNYLKAAAVYTQAIKADSSNAALYSNRAAAFLNLLKVTKALADAEMTIKLNPTWEKGYFRKGCVLEAMQRFEEALVAFRCALEQNPQSAEVSMKIKRLSQVLRDQKRAQDKKNGKTNGEKQNDSESAAADNSQGLVFHGFGNDLAAFAKDVMEAAIREWNSNNGKIDAGVRFFFGNLDNPSKEFLPLVAVDKAFESPDTLQSCVSFLRQYAVDSSSKAACLVVAKKTIAFPQVWKGTGTRKWKASHSSGMFVQLESPVTRRLWFVPSATEKGRAVCRTPELLDIDLHAVLPPLYR